MPKPSTQTTTTAQPQRGPFGARTSTTKEKARKQKLVAEVSENLTEAAAARRNVESEAYLDYAFYRGEQYAIYDAATRTLSTADDNLSPKVVVNLVKDKVDRQHGFATDARPTLSVIPTSSDPAKITHAKVIDRWLKYLWNKLRLEEKLNRFIRQALIYPNSYLKVYWDPEADAGTGEIVVDNLSFFQGYFAPSATSLDDTPYFLCAVPRTVSYIQNRYGVAVESDERLTFTGPEERIAQEELSGTLTSTSAAKHALVVERWTTEGVTTTAGGKLLREDTGDHKPYAHGELPIIDLKYTELERAYGQSYASQFRRPQQAYNKILRKILQNIDRNDVVRYFALKGTRTSKSLTGEDGEMLEYTPPAGNPTAGPPSPVAGTPLPPEVFRQLKDLEAVMDKLAGHSDVGPRMLNAKVSGEALNAYQEMSNVKVRLFTRKVELAMQRLGRQLLGLMRQYYTTERTFTLYEKGKVEEYTLKPEMISDLDVSITIGSALPEGRAARKDFVLGLYAKQIIDKTEVRKLLDLEGVIPEVAREVVAAPVEEAAQSLASS